MNKELLYPDGEPCHVGDLVWFNEGLCIGRVADILSATRMRAKLDAEWSGGSVLFINCGLSEHGWGAPYSYDESQLEEDGIGRLSGTEELAVELLFHLLGRQLSQTIWENPNWHYVAWLEPLPLGEGREGYDWVWNLAFAPKSNPEQVQRYRFNRLTRRFQSPEEPYTPTAQRETRPDAASFTTSRGDTYREGDLVWVHGRLGVTTVLIRRIIHPGDPDEEWLNGGKPLREPWVETTDLEREDGGTIEASSHFEQECCGGLSSTEELAVDLLFHLLEQHSSYPMRATSIQRCGLSVKPAPPLPGERRPNWRYARARRRLSIFICNERDPMLGEFLCYRFKRRLCDFSPEPRP